MLSNPVLNIVISLVFIYLLYSLLATIVQEMIATKLAFRAKVLERAIIRMLEDGKSTSGNKVIDRFYGIFHLLGRPNLLKDRKTATWFYLHPLVKYLGEDNYYSKPAYITAQNFSKVMTDLLGGISDANRLQKINDAINGRYIHHLPVEHADDSHPAVEALQYNMTGAVASSGIPVNATQLNKDTALFLKAIWIDSNGDLAEFRLKLEQWFDDTMDRATGWYKRYTKFVLLIIGFIIAMIFNVDSIGITRTLRSNPQLAAQMAQTAQEYLDKNKELNAGPVTSAEDSISRKVISDSLVNQSNMLMTKAKDLYNNEIESVNRSLSLGWNVRPDHEPVLFGWINTKGVLCLHCNPQVTLRSFLGWLITAFALSLGAPFWFDLLNKLMQLRGTGDKIDTGAGNRNLPPAPKDNPAPVVNVISNGGNLTGEAVG